MKIVDLFENAPKSDFLRVVYSRILQGKSEPDETQFGYFKPTMKEYIKKTIKKYLPENFMVVTACSFDASAHSYDNQVDVVYIQGGVSNGSINQPAGFDFDIMFNWHNIMITTDIMGHRSERKTDITLKLMWDEEGNITERIEQFLKTNCAIAVQKENYYKNKTGPEGPVS